MVTGHRHRVNNAKQKNLFVESLCLMKYAESSQFGRMRTIELNRALENPGIKTVGPSGEFTVASRLCRIKQEHRSPAIRSKENWTAMII